MKTKYRSKAFSPVRRGKSGKLSRLVPIFSSMCWDGSLEQGIIKSPNSGTASTWGEIASQAGPIFMFSATVITPLFGIKTFT